jgi:hypothetical protein
MSNIEDWRCMMALMVLIGDEELEAYESRLLDNMEPCDAEDERRRELRMLENESDWKRVVRILAGRNRDWWERWMVGGGI